MLQQYECKYIRKSRASKPSDVIGHAKQFLLVRAGSVSEGRREEMHDTHEAHVGSYFVLLHALPSRSTRPRVLFCRSLYSRLPDLRASTTRENGQISLSLLVTPKLTLRLFSIREKSGTDTRAVHKAISYRSDLSVENGLSRLKPKSGFLTQSKNSFFDSTFFD